MGTYVITGANRGIGFELAKQISLRGDMVIALCRTSSPQLDQLGIAAIKYQLDEGSFANRTVCPENTCFENNLRTGVQNGPSAKSNHLHLCPDRTSTWRTLTILSSSSTASRSKSSKEFLLAGTPVLDPLQTGDTTPVEHLTAECTSSRTSSRSCSQS